MRMQGGKHERCCSQGCWSLLIINLVVGTQLDLMIHQQLNSCCVQVQSNDCPLSHVYTIPHDNSCSSRHCQDNLRHHMGSAQGWTLLRLSIFRASPEIRAQRLSSRHTPTPQHVPTAWHAPCDRTACHSAEPALPPGVQASASRSSSHKLWHRMVHHRQ